jgi:hypothetical protein
VKKEGPPKPKPFAASAPAWGPSSPKANATLSKKSKAMKQIMDEAGLTATVYNHMNRLAKAGLIRRTDDGYCLTS